MLCQGKGLQIHDVPGRVACINFMCIPVSICIFKHTQKYMYNLLSKCFTFILNAHKNTVGLLFLWIACYIQHSSRKDKGVKSLQIFYIN